MNENGTNTPAVQPKTEHSSSNPKQALAGHTSNVEILTKDTALLSKTEDLKALPADVRSRLAVVWDIKVPGMDDTRQHYHSFEVIQDTASPQDLKKFREDLLALLNKRVEFEAKQVEIYQAKSNQSDATQTSLQAKPENTATAQASVNTNATRQSTGMAWHKSPMYQGDYVSGMYAAKAQAQFQAASTSTQESFKPHVNETTDASALWTSSDEHRKSHTAVDHANLDPYKTPITGFDLKRASKWFALGTGLMAAAETASATPGPMSAKLDAASKILREEVVNAIPGVSAVKEWNAGHHEAAGVDLVSNIPVAGDAIDIAYNSIVREPEVRAVIDALPKDKATLEKMQGDKTLAPINRHLAETQLAIMQAKEQGDIFKGLAMSSRLTDLAEQKLQLKAEWTNNARAFDKTIHAPESMLVTISKNHPDIAPHIAIHTAMINKDYPPAFIQQMDATLSKNIADGTPISPQMLQITHNLQASTEQTHALTK